MAKYLDQRDALYAGRTPRPISGGLTLHQLHGCCDELEDLLVQLGYQRQAVEVSGLGWSPLFYAHPAGRKAVFVGDLVDPGP